MKRILIYAGLHQTVFIPENIDRTYGQPWVENNTTSMFEVVARILRQTSEKEAKLIYLSCNPRMFQEGAIDYAPNGL